MPFGTGFEQSVQGEYARRMMMAQAQQADSIVLRSHGELLGLSGCAPNTTYVSYADYSSDTVKVSREKRPLTIREELQADIDSWLYGID